MTYFEQHPEETLQAIRESVTLVEVLSLLKLNNNGGNKRSLRQFIQTNNIDTNHFTKRLSRDTYETAPKVCKFCGKSLPWEKRVNQFCNSSCAASYNNKQSVKVLPEVLPEAKIKKVKTSLNYCLNCGKQLTERQNKYCSLRCQSDFQQKEFISKWKRGEESGLSGEYGISKRIRRYFFEKYQCKCQLCGWGEENIYTHSIPLELHHIDGNYLNNSESNLQLLCPNCHSLTDTYKSHNKEGRKERSKYT